MPLVVAWSLVYEVRFYLVFALLLVSVRAGIAFILFWLASVLVVNFAYPAVDWDVLNLVNFYFPCGMLGCWLLTKLDNRLGPWLLAAGLVPAIALASTVHGPISDYRTDKVLMLGMAAPLTLIMMGAVLTERLYNWKAPKLLMFFGQASYSIYLVHSAGLSLIVILIHKYALHKFPSLLVFIVCFTFAVSCGILAHLLVERPLTAWLQGKAKAAAPRIAVPVAVAGEPDLTSQKAT